MSFIQKHDFCYQKTDKHHTIGSSIRASSMLFRFYVVCFASVYVESKGGNDNLIIKGSSVLYICFFVVFHYWNIIKRINAYKLREYSTGFFHNMILP